MKIIFVTGGVLSGIGKGIAAASIGALLKGSGQSVFCQKFDGYLNVDPGTMSPVQHGEVFVTEDGAETDLDIGHYERFLDINLNKFSSFTSGKLYETLIARERKGEYLGGTVQIVPHLTDLVQEMIYSGNQSTAADISIVEIGGTVGDMENEYLLESARQLRHKLGAGNVIFIHVALLPYLQASKELKSKPIQHSVRTLMGYGIQPDFLIVRADAPIPEEMMKKIAQSNGLSEHQIIAAPTLESIYQVPLAFQRVHFGEHLLAALQLPENTPKLSEWEILGNNIAHSTDIRTIGIVGKYVGLEDAYYSLNEGLKCAGFAHNIRIKLEFIEAEDIEQHGTEALKGLDGICIPGGFGVRGTEGMILAAQFARENTLPFLGICLGSQIMALEFARNVLKIADASSEEFKPESQNKIIHIMDSQKEVQQKGGTMRLGNYSCHIREGTLAHKLYKATTVQERHRHRYEFNPAYRDALEQAGCIVSASSPDGLLAEIIEIQNHPFMIATQAHPELISRPTRPHPLFMGFIAAIK